MLARLREARKAEDAALVVVARAQAAVEAAAEKRAGALIALDAAVTDAETELTQAHNHLVDAAGLDRAAVVLGMHRSELRKKRSTSSRDNHLRTVGESASRDERAR
jgi:hypothetical protein